MRPVRVSRRARAYEQRERVSLFRQACAAKGLPMPEAEYVFAPPRKWRFDFAWPDAKLALERDGGVFAVRGGKRCPWCLQTPKGRHTRGAGWLKDTEKFNEAAARGWRIVRCTPSQLGATATFTLLRRCLVRQALDELASALRLPKP